MGQQIKGTVDDFYVYTELGSFFEVFDFGEKLKAAEKTKIVRAPPVSSWDVQNVDLGSLCQTRKSGRGSEL